LLLFLHSLSLSLGAKQNFLAVGCAYLFICSFLYSCEGCILLFFISCYCFAGSEFSEDNFVAKVKMEIVVSKDQV
jgi:hypothetical protein